MGKTPDSIDTFLESLGLIVEKPSPLTRQPSDPTTIMDIAFDSMRGCIFLYYRTHQDKVELPITFFTPTFDVVRGRVIAYNTNLDSLFEECESELNHRGFRFGTNFQTSNDGRLVARIFEFKDTTGNFKRELGQLMDYFVEKYKPKPQ